MYRFVGLYVVRMPYRWRVRCKVNLKIFVVSKSKNYYYSSNTNVRSLRNTICCAMRTLLLHMADGRVSNYTLFNGNMLGERRERTQPTTRTFVCHSVQWSLAIEMRLEVNTFHDISWTENIRQTNFVCLCFRWLTVTLPNKGKLTRRNIYNVLPPSKPIQPNHLHIYSYLID